MPLQHRLFRRLALSAAAACALVPAPDAGAQRAGWQALPGADAERYLRALQVAGQAPRYPWSIRGFSPAEVDRLLAVDSAGPWRDRASPGGDGVRLLPARLDLSWNSRFPYGRNDGPVWAGRGLTASGSLAAGARRGALSVRLEPMAVWAQNRAFDLMPPRPGAPSPFSDPQHPGAIDLPQRFGDDPWTRLDPGQSTARVDAAGFALGVSTANQQWGPAVDHPLVLGPNAPGFPHAFLGTASPWKVGVGRLHARLVWGRLSQSPYSAVPADSAGRFASGLAAVFLPWGLDGLEVGVTRFFHLPGPGAPELGDFLRPIETFFKANLRETGEGPDQRSDAENQLASLHARWVLPRGGFEVYGEYVREDHNWDLLDFILEPDHSSSYLLGGARAWRRGRSLLWVRAELVESQASHLLSVRTQGPLYRHARARQGHTHAGQLLGSPAGYGGGGSVLAFEAFTPRGRWSVDWTRTRVRDNWGALARVQPDTAARTDVVHSLGAEAAFFRGRVDALARLRASWELNRNLAGDAFNLTASFGLRLGL